MKIGRRNKPLGSWLAKLRSRHNFQRFKADLLQCLLFAEYCAILGSLSTFSDRQDYLIDLASQFFPQYCLLGIVGLLVSVFICSRRLFVTSLFAALLSGWILLPWYSSHSQPRPATADDVALRLLSANLRVSNQRTKELLEVLSEAQPDIAVFLEVNDVWGRQLEKLRPQLPYSFRSERADAFGIALLSRFPFVEVKKLDDPDFQTPVLSAEMNINGQSVRVIAAHPLPPGSANLARRRNRQLQALARYIHSRQSPAILMGDLNTCGWSNSGRNFLTTSGLKEARQGFGILATWPSFIRPFGIPIDHILHSTAFQTLTIETLSLPGSDHAGLSAVLRSRSSTTAK
jgi:endonuclease/exonuclease/phosphatase (EEP) superfamily protein YafD